MAMEAFDPWELSRLPARKARTPWCEAAATVVLRRVAAGETLRAISADADMPPRTTVNYWMKSRADFRRAFLLARAEAGKAGLGWTHGYCNGVGEEICQRLAEGETLTSICRDPWMPERGRVYRWMDALPEFGRAVRVAREAQAGGLAEAGWELAMGAGREDAYLTHVRLTYLRWLVGKLGPQGFGPVKAAEGEAARAARQAEKVGAEKGGAGACAPYTVVIRRFGDPPDEDVEDFDL